MRPTKPTYWVTIKSVIDALDRVDLKGLSVEPECTHF
jgi:hypothetical protein